MDMMVAEEARLSADRHKEDNLAMVNSDTVREAISDPDNKFQKAIAAWRGTYNCSFCLLEQDSNPLVQALICLHWCRS